MKTWNEVVRDYEIAIKEGPIYVCVSCDRLFFKNSIKNITKEKLVEKNCTESFLHEIILAKYNCDSDFKFCSTCYQAVAGKKKRYPRYNINMSQLAFPDVPEIVKNLTALEERLVAPRIPFMKIFALGIDRQFGIRSGVINVPINVPRVFKTIPISPSQSGTIQLKLKRKMVFKHSYLYETIRPLNVFEAGKLLVQTPLYQEEGINLDEFWPQQSSNIFNPDFDLNESTSMINYAENQSENVIAQDTVLNSSDNQNSEARNDVDQYAEFYEETLIDSNEAIEFAPGKV